MIIYSDHLKLKLKLRNFPYNYPKLIYNTPEFVFKDTRTGSFISVSTLFYNGKLRKISIAYIFDEDNVKIKTIHPESDVEINNRIKKGRYEKAKKV